MVQGQVPPPNPPKSRLRIGDVAIATGLSRDALRFYEREGLIRASRAANGYRQYPPETVELLKYVGVAQTLGFTLAEIKQSLPRLFRANDTEAEIVRLLEAKLAMVERRIDELSGLRCELRERLATACANRLVGPAGAPVSLGGPGRRQRRRHGPSTDAPTPRECP